MNKYQEWNHLKELKDNKNPFSTLYEYPDGERFYIEPIYYSYLSEVFNHYPDKKDIILREMERIVKRNKVVIFTGMDEEEDEEPLTKNDSAIYRTIYDVLDKLGIYIENKSRGSDYGD